MFDGFRSRWTTRWRCAYATAAQTFRNRISRSRMLRPRASDSSIEVPPRDVLHDEVRETVLGRAAVEDARDVGVVEVREDPPLVAESLEDEVGVHAAANELDRDGLLEALVAPRGEVDGPHPAVPELAHDLVRARSGCGAPPRTGSRARATAPASRGTSPPPSWRAAATRPPHGGRRRGRPRLSRNAARSAGGSSTASSNRSRTTRQRSLLIPGRARERATPSPIETRASRRTATSRGPRPSRRSRGRRRTAARRSAPGRRRGT